MSLELNILEGTMISEDSIKNHLIDITKRVFNTLVLIDVQDDLPLKKPISRFHASITSMVGLAGTYSGIVSIHCPIKLATKFTSNMLGVEVTGISADVNDAMGEIANILGGDIKHVLSKRGMDINLSIPTVIYGDEYTIEFASEEHSLLIPFNTDNDHFLVGINLQQD